jgi:hypothetical protein
MGDVSIPPDPPNKVGAKVQDLIESGHELYASAVTGSPQGRVRRPTLFAIAAIGTVVGTQFFVGAVVALIAIVLLAVTDSVVEL